MSYNKKSIFLNGKILNALTIYSICRTNVLSTWSILRKRQECSSSPDDYWNNLHRWNVLWIPCQSHRHRAKFCWYTCRHNEHHCYYTWINCAYFCWIHNAWKSETILFLFLVFLLTFGKFNFTKISKVASLLTIKFSVYYLHLSINISYLQQTIEAWRVIFFLTAALYIVELLIYTMFGTGKEQPWNKVKSDEDSEMPAQTVPLKDSRH